MRYLFITISVVILLIACSPSGEADHVNKESIAQTPVTPSSSNSSPEAGDTNTPYSLGPTAARLNATQHARYPVWGKHCTGTGPVMFANSPMRLEDINFISPYGDIVGGHVTPIDHMYFEVKDRSLGRDAYEVRAIQDAIIYDIQPRDRSVETNQAQARDWRLDMAHNCTFASYFDLLTSITPEIEEEWERTLKNDMGLWDGISVKAGQLIGYVGAQTLDFGVYDYEIELPGLINPDAYAEREPWKIHTVDPFQYFPKEAGAALLTKMIRAVEPRAGKIDYDVAGTLSGNWFEQGTNWYDGINQRKYWEGHLSIAPHQIDPSLWRIGIGFLDVDANNFIITGEHDLLLVGASSDAVSYELHQYTVYIPEKPEKQWWREPYEGEIFGVKVFPEVIGIVMLDLDEHDQLKAEVFLGESTGEVREFTETARIYQR